MGKGEKWPTGGRHLWGGVRPGGGPKVGGGGGATRDPLLPHAYLQGGCVSGVGLGKLLVAVVKQGLQMGRCAHSGCGDLHFATNDICLAPRLANLALKTWMVLMKGKHAQKNFGAVGAMAPTPLSLKTRGGGGGGWGVSHTRTGPGCPPRDTRHHSLTLRTTFAAKHFCALELVDRPFPSPILDTTLT